MLIPIKLFCEKSSLPQLCSHGGRRGKSVIISRSPAGHVPEGGFKIVHTHRLPAGKAGSVAERSDGDRGLDHERQCCEGYLRRHCYAVNGVAQLCKQGIEGTRGGARRDPLKGGHGRCRSGDGLDVVVR